MTLSHISDDHTVECQSRSLGHSPQSWKAQIFSVSSGTALNKSATWKSISIGSTRFPKRIWLTKPKSETWKIGASASLLIATMTWIVETFSPYWQKAKRFPPCCPSCQPGAGLPRRCQQRCKGQEPQSCQSGQSANVRFQKKNFLTQGLKKFTCMSLGTIPASTAALLAPTAAPSLSARGSSLKGVC